MELVSDVLQDQLDRYDEGIMRVAQVQTERHEVGVQASFERSDAETQTDIKNPTKCTEQSNFSIAYTQGDSKATQFYTGLPIWAVFLHLYMFLSPFLYIAKHSHHFLQENELLLVLMKLRMTEDLAIRFGISVGTMCHIQQRWLDVMHVRLKFLIMWPEREILRENMPVIVRVLS